MSDTPSASPRAKFTPQKNQEAPPAAQGSPQDRVFGNSRTIDHDLFKLLVAPLQRDVSWNDRPDIETIEHCHFFHTIDSDGRVQTYSTPTASHFHKMEVVPNADPTKPPTVRCASGPLKWVRKRIRGKMTKLVESTSTEDCPDDHTHEVLYRCSNKVAVRTANAAAVAIITAEAQKTAPIPGVSA